MTPFLTLVSKQLGESRWFLALVGAAMGGLGWLGVYQTKSLVALMNGPEGERRAMPVRFIERVLGGSAYDGSTLAMEVARWNLPFLPLLLTCWAIARGSAAVAGEIERGTMDLVLSRPVGRLAYLAAQVTSAVLGFVLVLGALVLGNQVANRYYVLDDPPGLVPLLRPALNLLAFGLSIYGYTIVVSALDVVRWRATLVGSALTIGGLIAYLVANDEALKERWYWLEWLSVFKGYAPVEAAVKGEQLAAHAAALGGVGLAGIVAAYLIFQGRDLPANS